MASVSEKRFIPTDEDVTKFIDLFDQKEFESLVSWWVLYSKSRADERNSVFSEFPPTALKKYESYFRKNLMGSKRKKSDAFSLMQKVFSYLQKHPERITPYIYDMLIEEPKLHYIVSLVSRKQDEEGNYFLVPSKGASQALNVLDAQTAINLQNLGIMKLKEIMEAMSSDKIAISNLGTLSKAARDLVATLHVLDLDHKADDELIKEYKQIEHSEDGKVTRETIARFIQKNQKDWNG